MNQETTHFARTPPQPEAGRVDWGKFGWGMGLIIVGGLLLLERFNLVDISQAWRLAPWILIFFGVVGLLRGRNAEERDSGWWQLLIGGYLLINFNQLWGFSWTNSWPLILLAIGFSMFVDPENPEQRANSFWLLGIGGFFLIQQNDFFETHATLAWPFLLIAAGLALTWQALFKTDRDQQRGPTDGR